MKTIPFNNRIATFARTLAHSCTFGTNKTIIVLCDDPRTKYYLCIALLEWCKQQHWACVEHCPCKFLLRNGTVRIVDVVDFPLKNAEIVQLAPIKKS